MNYTDPTYLRTIHDGLLLGTIHKDNASNLPIGLIGIYEEALPPASNVKERKKFLEFFSVWALLKKEVSAAFVVPLLEGWTEEHVLDYISEYSKWFNSPVSGKYVLYHERLRAFVLQKISNNQIVKCNYAIINQCQSALQTKAGDEWECYALEHLSHHLLIKVMDSKDATALKTLAYSTTHWNRQVEISKGFEWSKRMLNDMMLWASKYDDDEVINCALSKVDLHRQEQNDAPHIVELVAKNDIETGLQRIESFGGNDKEGFQRKSMLYMLCLMELTILETKDKPIRKQAIEKFLKHLDDNLPLDHSVLSWNEFMPDSLIKQIIFYLDTNGIDFVPFSKRSKLKVDSDSLVNYSANKKSHLNQYEYEYRNNVGLGFLENLDSKIIFGHEKDINSDFEEEARKSFEIALDHLSKDEINKASRKIKQGLFYSEKIPSDDMWGSYGNHLMGNFAENAVNIGFHKLGVKILEKMEKGSGWTDFASENISSKLLERGDLTNLELVYLWARKDRYSSSVSHVLRCLIDFHFSTGSWHFIKATLLSHLNYDMQIIDGFMQLSFFNEVIHLNTSLKTIELLFESEIIKSSNNVFGHRLIDLIIKDYSEKHGLKHFGKDIISIVNFVKEDYLKACLVEQYANEIIKSSDGIKFVLRNGWYREDGQIDSYFERIFIAICEEVGLDEGINLISKIENKGICRYDAAKGLLKAYLDFKIVSINSQFINCEDVVQRLASFCDNEVSKDRMLSNLVGVLIQYSKFDEALNRVAYITNKKKKYRVLLNLYEKLHKQKNINTAQSIMLEILECARGISEESAKNEAFKDICITLAEIGESEDALKYVQGISDQSDRSITLKYICDKLIKQGKIEEALECARCIRDSVLKSRSLLSINVEMAKQDMIEESTSALKEALECIPTMSSESEKCSLLEDVSNNYIKQGKIAEALECAQSIPDVEFKSRSLLSISVEFAIQGKVEEALKCTQSIPDVKFKSRSLLSISVELLKQKKVEESAVALKEALECVRSISSESEKCNLLKDISSELINQGKFEDAFESLIEIDNYKEREDAITKMLIFIIEQGGINKVDNIEIGLIQLKKFKSLDVKKRYLRNWAQNIQIMQVNMSIIKPFIHLLTEEIDILEMLLQCYATNQILFKNIDKNKANEFQTRLNVKWAIDLNDKLK